MTRLVLLRKVQKKRAEHVEDYRKAMKEWRYRMRLICNEIWKNGGRLVAFPRDLSRLTRMPECHLKDFDEAIEMLNCASDKEISLNALTFGQLVGGKFEGVEHARLTNSMYDPGDRDPDRLPRIREKELEPKKVRRKKR
jgi:hypothetical protein